MWKTLLKVVTFFAIIGTIFASWIAFTLYPSFFPITYEVRLLDTKKTVLIEAEFRASIGDSIKVAPYTKSPGKWYAAADVYPEYEGQPIYYKEIGVIVGKP